MIHTISKRAKHSHPRVHRRYDKAHARLESARQDYRQARRKLIDVIHCDGKDELSTADKKGVKAAFSAFLKAQRRLLAVFYHANETTGHLLRHAASQGDPRN
jgi:hypothetical protein